MSPTYLAIGILAIGFLIFVHELGHFLAAKWCGVKVERFAIGFGPRLIGFVRGETEYALCAIPLGGYVKMHGDSYEEFEGGVAKGLETVGFEPKNSEPGNEAAEKPEPPDPSRSFLKKPIPQRILIALAGPAFNLIFAFVLFMGYQMSVRLPVPVIGGIVPGSPAELAGLKPGDRITAIGTITPRNFEEVLLGAEQAGTGTVPLSYVRDGETRSLTVEKPQVAPADDFGQSGWLGVSPPIEARIGRFVPGSAAEAAGFRQGDLVAAIDGKPVRYFYDMAIIVRSSEGRPMEFTLKRGTDQVKVSVTARQPESLAGKTDAEGNPVKVPWLIGVEPDFNGYERGSPMPLWPAMQSAAHQVATFSAMIPKVFYQMLSRQRPASELGGPIEIVKQIGNQAEQSLTQVIRLVGLISVNLGIVNLFPIPVLDGGHIVMFLMEAVNRKPVSLRLREVMQGFGLVFILGLLVIALYNDIMRNFIN